MILQSDDFGWIFGIHLDSGLVRFTDGTINQLQQQGVVESSHNWTV